MLICPKCNYENELGRIFCHQCGTKLDLDKIKPSSGGKIVRRKGRWTVMHIVNRLCWLAVLVFLGWGLYLIGQTPDLPPVKPTAAEMAAVDGKRAELERSILRKTTFKMEITAAELNTLLASLDLEKQAGSGPGMEPITLQVELGDGTVTLNLLGTARLVGALSKKIFISYTGVPTMDNGAFEFKPIAAKIGQVPIHPKVLNGTDCFRKYFGRLLSKLDHEKSLLDQLSSLSVERGQIQINYQPAAKSTAR